MTEKAVIFDLDGVIVSTDHFHFLAWKNMADGEGIPFTEHDNEALRGVSRAESLELILRKAQRSYSDQEKLDLMERKNSVYRGLLTRLTAADILPGVAALLTDLRAAGAKLAIGSSSKNTPFILERIGYGNFFDAVADGNDIRRSKPDPEVFLLAAARLGIAPGHCVVVEDAEAGLQAARGAGMKTVGVGSAAGSPLADLRAPDLTGCTADDLLRL